MARGHEGSGNRLRGGGGPGADGWVFVVDEQDSHLRIVADTQRGILRESCGLRATQKDGDGISPSKKDDCDVPLAGYRLGQGRDPHENRKNPDVPYCPVSHVQ